MDQHIRDYPLPDVKPWPRPILIPVWIVLTILNIAAMTLLIWGVVYCL